MSEMKLSQLNVDLLQDQANVTLTKQVSHESGRSRYFQVLISTHVGLKGSQSEVSMKRSALEEASKVLREALSTLERHEFE